ncbi:hypothetical protein L7F22_026729 [Adiantum nelumboides]|nr:hypothetical protein [Adiantum nelumboides]
MDYDDAAFWAECSAVQSLDTDVFPVEATYPLPRTMRGWSSMSAVAAFGCTPDYQALCYWKIKPDVSDLDESLNIMKKFNLGCLFPLERRVLSSVTTEVGELREPYSENGGKPSTFKRARNRRHGTSELQLEDVSGGNTKTSSSREEEILTP